MSLFSCGSSRQINPALSAEEEYNQAWTGRSHAEIVQAFGAPDRVESDGRDGRILVYETVTTTTRSDVDTHFGMFDPDVTTTMSTDKRYTHFFLGPDGLCYLVRSNTHMPGSRFRSRALRNISVWWGISSGAALLVPVIFWQAMR